MRNKTVPGPLSDWQDKLQKLLTVDRQAIGCELGVTERTVYNWAHGKSTPRPQDLKWLIRWGKK
jgi:transcriptional regulator with XRE-family HTH domain